MAGRGASSLVALRRRAREAERRAGAAADRANRLAAGVSADRDLEGDVARCAGEAAAAHGKCRQEVRRCDEAAHPDPYADREERRDAAQDAARHARHADLYADEAEMAADGAEWAAKQIEAGDREMAGIGADWTTTYRAWRKR
jgi:hypothetical protein